MNDKRKMLDNKTTDAGAIPTIAATIEIETKVEVSGGSVTMVRRCDRGVRAGGDS